MTDKELSELFRTHYPRLYRLAYSLLNDTEDSRDVVSGVFAELLTKQIQANDVKAYLAIMVRNQSVDILRHRQIKDEVRVKILQEYEQGLTHDSFDDDQIDKIRLFINKELTLQTRRVLQRCYDDKKSYKEVASELGISVQAVNKHISQALRKLRERFNPSFKTW